MCDDGGVMLLCGVCECVSGCGCVMCGCGCEGCVMMCVWMCDVRVCEGVDLCDDCCVCGCVCCDVCFVGWVCGGGC